MWWRESLPESIILIYPRQPMVEWVRSVRDGDERITLESLKQYPNAIKIKHRRQAQSYEDYLKVNLAGVFEVEFGSWAGDQDLWPKGRNWKLFQTWFDYTVISSVYEVE